MRARALPREGPFVSFESDRVLGALVLFCAAIIVLGGLADRATQVSPTVRDGVTSKGESTALDALAERLGGQDRYLPYLELRRSSPRASIVLDERVPTGVLGEDQRALVHEPYLYALSGARELRRERLDVELVAGTQQTASGSFHVRDWRLHLLDPGSAGAELLVWQDERGLVIADARLVTGRFGLAQPALEVDHPAGSPRLRRAVLVDAGLLTGLFVLGGMLTPAVGLPALIRGGLALTVGLGLQVGAGLVRLPGSWSVLLVATAAAVVSLLARRAGHRVGWSRRDLPLIGSGAVAILLVSILARWSGFIWVSPDSVNYLAQSRMLADGFFASRNIDLKRGLGQQSIHAPGFALGVEGLQSLGLATLILAVLLIAALPLALQVNRSWIPWVAAVMLSGGLVASPAFPIMASYLNSHVLVAVLMLAFALLLGLQRASTDDVPDRADERVWATSVLVAALVLLRPEGTLLAATMLIGASAVAPRITTTALRVLGGTTIVWNLVLIQTSIAREEAASAPVIAMLVLGVGLLVLPAVRELLHDALTRRLPLVMAVTLWTIAFLLSALGGESVNFLGAATANLGNALGSWGVLGLAIVILGIAVAGWPLSEHAGPGAHAARWAVVSFIPMTMITKLGDGLERSGAGVDVLLRGGGRIGWGDSVNRMWTHVLLLVLLLAVVRASSVRSEAGVQDPSAGRGRAIDAP